MLYQREVQFDSFEEFNSFPHGWDADFSTTSPRDYSASLGQSVAPGLLVNTARFSSPTLQRGSTPVGMRTFALPLKLPDPYCWRGLPVQENTLIIFPQDRELFSTMGADVEILTISIDQKLADSSIEAWEVNPETVFDTPLTVGLTQPQYYAMRRNLSLVSEFMLKYGEHRQFPLLSRGVQEYLLENMFRPVIGDLSHTPVRQSFAAGRVKAATDYILDNLYEPLTVADVCKQINCSRRSLEQCFQKYAGTSPKQVIQLLRFQHCRTALEAASPKRTVSEIAGEHGFWHMGQFSGTYRRLFREPPAQTLHRRH